MSSNITEKQIAQLLQNAKNLAQENSDLKVQNTHLNKECAGLRAEVEKLSDAFKREQSLRATAEQSARISQEKLREVNDKYQQKQLTDSDENNTLLAELAAFNKSLEQAVAAVESSETTPVDAETSSCEEKECNNECLCKFEFSDTRPCENEGQAGACDDHYCRFCQKGFHMRFKPACKHCMTTLSPEQLETVTCCANPLCQRTFNTDYGEEGPYRHCSVECETSEKENFRLLDDERKAAKAKRNSLKSKYGVGSTNPKQKNFNKNRRNNKNVKTF